MNELKNGIIKIGDVLITRNLVVEDFENLSSELVDISYSKRGTALIKFKNPIISEDVDMYLEVTIFKDEVIPEIELWPKFDKEISDSEERAKYRLELSKKWLKGIMDVEPTTEGENSILYSFDWGYVTARCYVDRDYGMAGGNIQIEYRDK